MSAIPGSTLCGGVSIVLVDLLHATLQLRLSHGQLAPFFSTWLAAALTKNGYQAVVVFFVISGFLITSRSLARWGSLTKIDVAKFYSSRATRILPCFLLLLAVLSLLNLAHVQHFVIDNPKQSLGRALIAALGLHLNWYESVTGYLPANWDVLWSLSIEEAFYLAFPLVCLALRRAWLLVPALVALVVSVPQGSALPGSDVNWFERAYLTGMSAIAVGVLAALLAANYRVSKRLALLLQIVGIVILAAVFTLEQLVWSQVHNGATLALTLPTAAILLALRWRGSRRELPGFGWLRSFGRLSYEIYLSHMFVVWAVIAASGASGLSQEGPIWLLAALGLSWVLGWAIANWISVPMERYLRRM